MLLRSTFDVRYAFIDFGSASKFDPDVPLADIQATKAAMTVPYKAPEVSNGCPYNPFAADVSLKTRRCDSFSWHMLQVFSLAVVVAKKMSDDLKVRTSRAPGGRNLQSGRFSGPLTSTSCSINISLHFTIYYDA